MLCSACAGGAPDVRHYDCEQGGLLQLTIRSDTATLRFDGRRHVLPRVAATDGERWAADGILLWIKDGEPSVTVGDQVLVWGCRAR